MAAPCGKGFVRLPQVRLQGHQKEPEQILHSVHECESSPLHTWRENCRISRGKAPLDGIRGALEGGITPETPLFSAWAEQKSVHPV